MTQNSPPPNSGTQPPPYQTTIAASYYGLLGVSPSASARAIRQAYRELSKQYHPDTTTLPAPLATAQFQRLNEAYATLSNPERRLAYDLKIGYSRVAVVQPLPPLHSPQTNQISSSAYLDPTDRPLSPGELFALFILGLTIVGCLLLAIGVALLRGDISMVGPSALPLQPSPRLVILDRTTIDMLSD